MNAFVITEAHRNQAAYAADMRGYFYERNPEWTILTTYIGEQGAAVTLILNDAALRNQWLDELSSMRDRMKDMRNLIVAGLGESAPDRDFSHIKRANGMFCYLGVSPEQVAKLKQDYGIYLVESGRINVCGITADNVTYLAESIASVL